MKYLGMTALAAATLIATSVGATAGTLTIDFERADGDGGTLVNQGSDGKYYEVGGYILDPVNLQGGLCFDDPSQSDCTIESTQTVEPTLYRIDGTDFDLYSFYFLNNGAGSGFDNRTTVTAFDAGGGEIDSFDFFIGLSLDAYASEGVMVTVAESSPVGNCATYATILCKGTGYIVNLGTEFTGVNSVVWTAEGDANARLDNLVVNQIPVPGSLPLLASAFGLGAMVMRRKRKTA
jgi:hypothetical protein